MAKTVNKTATAESAFGESLATPVSFGYDYVALESLSEVPDGTYVDADGNKAYDANKDERPSEKQILNLVNSLRNATARNRAQAKAFEAAGIKAPSVDPAESRRRTLVKTLVAEGATQEIAEQMADAMLKQFRG